jgi:NADPH-dependent curcumin reductase CurA
MRGLSYEGAPSLCLKKWWTMKNIVNRRWLLTAYPEGMPTQDNWIMDTQLVPDPGPGQILIKAKWLSVDPYMRGRMSPATNYTKGVGIGEVMQGGGVGEVVASNHPAWKVGDIAESMGVGWQVVGVDARHSWPCWRQ